MSGRLSRGSDSSTGSVLGLLKSILNSLLTRVGRGAHVLMRGRRVKMLEVKGSWGQKRNELVEKWKSEGGEDAVVVGDQKKNEIFPEKITLDYIQERLKGLFFEENKSVSSLLCSIPSLSLPSLIIHPSSTKSISVATELDLDQHSSFSVSTFFFAFVNRLLMVLVHSVFSSVQPITEGSEIEKDDISANALVLSAVRASSAVSPFRRIILALETLRLVVSIACGDPLEDTRKDTPSTTLLSSFFFSSEFISSPFGLSSLLLIFSFLSNAFDSVRLLARDILSRLLITREGLEMMAKLRKIELKRFGGWDVNSFDEYQLIALHKHPLVTLLEKAVDSLLYDPALHGLHHYVKHFLSMPSFLLPSFLGLSTVSGELILNSLSASSSSSPPLMLLSLISTTYDSDVLILVDIIAMKIIQLLLIHAITYLARKEVEEERKIPSNSESVGVERREYDLYGRMIRWCFASETESKEHDMAGFGLRKVDTWWREEDGLKKLPGAYPLLKPPLFPDFSSSNASPEEKPVYRPYHPILLFSPPFFRPNTSLLPSCLSFLSPLPACTSSVEFSFSGLLNMFSALHFLLPKLANSSPAGLALRLPFFIRLGAISFLFFFFYFFFFTFLY
jgi:hypothetical protein